ncbi:O-methyltransferase [candidate division KSB1 bacterium]
MRTKRTGILLLFLVCLFIFSGQAVSQEVGQETEIDKKVKNLLQDTKYRWRDMNVPEVDGQKLYDLIIENNYKKALEVGTSTGHSGIWIAWALSKTGGKLITVEIDKDRYEEAVKNFEKAGLSKFIDARLADAHELIPELEGPFDFVFIDADKNWYTNYAKAVIPKLEKGACMTAHNVYDSSGRFRRGRSGHGYLEYVKSLSFLETTVFSSGGGIAISYKKE